MKVRHIYNACCIYESQGARLLTDPWLMDGAFEGSWAAYPPLKTKPQDVIGCDFLYISHLHPDHFDPETLQHFDRKIPVIIYENNRGLNFLKNKLMTMGFINIIGIKDGETYLIPPFRLTMYGPFSKHPFDPSLLGNFLDSALVIEAEGIKILNANDNTPTLEAASQIRKNHGPLRLVQLKDSLAGPYPSCFPQLNSYQKQQEAIRLVHRQTDHIVKVATQLDARYLQPFASSYRLQGYLSWKNAYLGLQDSFILKTKLEKEYSYLRPALLSENDVLDLETGIITYGEKNQMDFLIWEKLYSTKKYVYENDPLPVSSEIKESVSKAFEKLAQKQKQLNYFPDIHLTLSVSDPNYYLSASVSLRADNKIPSQKITARLPVRLLHRILHRKAHWNNSEVGCHIDFTREPNVYDPDFPNLMAFFHL